MYVVIYRCGYKKKEGTNMKEVIVRLSEDELKLIDYCMMLCLINSKQETKFKQQAKILITKLRKIRAK